MTTVNHDATQFVSAIFLDRYLGVAYSFTDVTGTAFAFGPTWNDWSAGYEAAQTAVYGFVLQPTDYNNHAGRFTPRLSFYLRWTGIPARAIWTGTMSLGLKILADTAIRAAPQRVSIYGLNTPNMPAFALDNTESSSYTADGSTYTDPQLVPLHKRFLLAQNTYNDGFPLGATPVDLTFTFDGGAVAHVLRAPGWNGSFGVMVETQRIPSNTENPGLETAVLSIHTPASLPGQAVARISGNQEILGPVGAIREGGRRSSRPDECPKCGSISFRETWQRDGLSHRLVCPDCWDPPLPTRRPPRTIRPVNDSG